MPRLTEIADPVSQQVRQQYEESPYPRWVTRCAHGAGGEHIRPSARTVSERAAARLRGARGAGHSGRGLRHRAAADRHRAAFPEGARAGDRSEPREPCLRQAQVRRGRRRDRIRAGRHSRARAGPALRHDRVRAACCITSPSRCAAGRRSWRCSSPAAFMRIGLYSEIGRRDVVALQQHRRRARLQGDRARHPALPPGADREAGAALRRRSCIRRSSTAPAPAAICCSTCRSTG